MLYRGRFISRTQNFEAGLRVKLAQCLLFQWREATHPLLPHRDHNDSLWRVPGEETLPGKAWKWSDVLAITALQVPCSTLNTTGSPYCTLSSMTLHLPGEKRRALQTARLPSTKLVQHRARSRAQVSQLPKSTFLGQNMQWEQSKSTTKIPLPVQRNRLMMVVSH